MIMVMSGPVWLFALRWQKLLYRVLIRTTPHFSIPMSGVPAPGSPGHIDPGIALSTRTENKLLRRIPINDRLRTLLVVDGNSL